MVVEWPVANLDFDALRSNRGGKKDARRNNGNEQKFVFNHTPLIRARASRHMGLSRTAGRARSRFDRIGRKAEVIPPRIFVLTLATFEEQADCVTPSIRLLAGPEHG